MKKLRKQPKKSGQEGFHHLGVLIEGVRDEVRTVAEMYGSMDKKIEIIQQDIEFIKHGLKKKVDIDEFATLERRVTLLERRR